MLDHQQLMNHQRVLGDFGDFALHSEDLDEVLTEACRLVGEALGTDRAKVLEIQDGGSELLVRAGVGWGPSVVGQVRLLMSERTSETFSIRQRKPVISQDIRLENRFEIPQFMKEAGVVALVNVPIFVPGQKPYGLLQVDASEPREFGQDDIEFLRTYAAIIGPVIDRLRKIRSLRASEERFRLIVETARDYAIFTTDAQDRINAWFAGAESVFGWTAQEAIGRSASMTFTSEDREAGEDEKEISTARREGSAANVRWHQRKDGKRVFIEGAVWALRDEAGRLQGFVKIGQDVTARREANERLRRSEERFRAFVTASSDAVYRMSPDWLQMQQLDGRGFLANTETPSDSWVESYILPEDRSALFAEIEAAIRDQRLFELEHQVRRADGGIGWTLSRAVPIFAEDGTILEWFGTASNVTSRKEAEAALRETEARLTAAFESVPVGVAVIDFAGRVVTSNQEYRRFLPNGLIPSRDPERAHRWKAWDSQGQVLDVRDYPGSRAMRGERTVPGQEMLYTDDDGQEIWTSVATTPIQDASGQIIGLASAISDIDALKRGAEALRQSEARLRTLVEGIPQLVWRAADSGVWTWASPQWSAYTGLSDVESRGHGWLAALHPDDRESATTFWEPAAVTGYLEMDGRLRHAADNSYRWFQTRASPVRDEAGRIVEWLGTSTDIDDLRLMQERQKVLVGELQHRTRNLMGVVRSMTEKTLDRSVDLADFKAHFGDRLAALARVQGLLSRLDEWDRVTFDELIASELAALDSDATRIALSGPTGVALRSSTVQTLALAFHELMTNALKYGALAQPNGRLVISWRTDVSDLDQQPWLHVDWRESGVVMPASCEAPRGGGSGRELIERALPYQLGAKTTYVMEPDGVHCTIALPISIKRLER
ncbi:PAS domain S-box protein [Methylobacterium gnaphalii]|uniref:Blue-light-activated histidine kinase n=1 Tax=Methylobacterium gnaphalii TaxID=1010610 RepID=A0A512JNB5_9HYPH|nr:PAS domain S-box protein [Methylobacterium gnaphalii]GEP11432.1 hypothetical protein MGN01_32770 [Methylobacterium gnaphalii]GJD71285.1 hypothetical protein MMMDOFMJ_4240 [Methylobacterium gnaphalii]GLS48026.1 hypothetical protein GCM10007885_08700 [Methylobacterium gnaphalii]